MVPPNLYLSVYRFLLLSTLIRESRQPSSETRQFDPSKEMTPYLYPLTVQGLDGTSK